MTKFLVMKSWATGMHTLKTVTGELLAPKMNLFFSPWENFELSVLSQTWYATRQAHGKTFTSIKIVINAIY